MKFKTYTGITWSLLELSGLLEDEDSRVYFERVKRHLGLHPFHLTNLQTALNEILSSNLNHYDAELKGFLLAYKNPKLLTSLGEIFYDTCFIHVDIEADFYVFRPEVGCSIKGTVNKKGMGHIGVLVHKAFNVSIPRPEDEDDWPGDYMEIGQEVRFVITHLDVSSRLPFIRGALRQDYLEGCRLPDKSNVVDESVENHEDAQEVNGTHVESEDVPRTKHSSHGDSESTVEEDTKETIVKKKQSKKKSVKAYHEMSDDELDGETKKRTKKLKEVKKECKQRNAENIRVENNYASSELEDDPEPIAPKTPKKSEKNKKSSKKHEEAKFVKVKMENSVANDSVSEENFTGNTSTPVDTKKSKKHSPKKKLSSSVEEVFEEESKTARLKKFRVSVSEDEVPVRIKVEPNQNLSEVEDSASTSANKSKKCGKFSEEEFVSPKSSPKKRSKKNSSVHEFDLGRVKTERVSESESREMEAVRLESPKKNPKREQTPVAEEKREPKKEKKEKSKRFSEILKIEPDFRSVRVKQEKLDDSLEDHERRNSIEARKVQEQKSEDELEETAKTKKKSVKESKTSRRKGRLDESEDERARNSVTSDDSTSSRKKSSPKKSGSSKIMETSFKWENVKIKKDKSSIFES